MKKCPNSMGDDPSQNAGPPKALLVSEHNSSSVVRSTLLWRNFSSDLKVDFWGLPRLCFLETFNSCFRIENIDRFGTFLRTIFDVDFQFHNKNSLLFHIKLS